MRYKNTAVAAAAVANQPAPDSKASFTFFMVVLLSFVAQFFTPFEGAVNRGDGRQKRGQGREVDFKALEFHIL